MAVESNVSWKLQEYNAHVGAVKCVALGKKSGRVLATGGDDKKVNIWSLDKPNCLVSLTGHEQSISAVKLSNSEHVVASGCEAGVIKIWDLDAAKNLNSLRGHKGAKIRSLEFYPMEGYVASTSVDCTVKLWDLRRKGCIHTFKGHQGPVSCVRFTPDCRWMISGDDTGKIKIWEIRDNRELCEFSEHTAAISTLQCHPCELLMTSGSTDGAIKFWDLTSMKPISCTSSLQKPRSPLGAIVFHPEGYCLYSTGKGIVDVFGWEPIQLYDSVNIPDGNLPVDVAVAHDQLTGACILESRVSTFVVEITKVAPVGSVGRADPVRHIPVSGDSGRKTFIAGRVEAPPSKEKKSVPAAADNDGGGDNDVEIKDPSFRLDEKIVKPFRPPAADSSDDLSAGQNRHSGDGGAAAAKRMSAVSESEALSMLLQGHNAYMDVMARRHRNTRVLRSEWLSRGHKAAVDIAAGMKDHAVISDLLKILLSDVNLWDLSLCQTLLPILSELISSKHDSYIHIGLSSLRLVGHQFGEVIKSNVSSPPPQGLVDFSRQERYMKCLSCFNSLVSIRDVLERNLDRYEGRLGSKFHEMYSLIQRFSNR